MIEPFLSATKMTDLLGSHFCADETALAALAAQLAPLLTAPTLVFFHGDLGAGKTCFIRYLLQARGVAAKIKSPTYTLLEVYQDALDVPCVHLDLYRLSDPREWYYLDAAHYLTEAIVLIEWPERAAECLPKPDLVCHLQVAGEGREILISVYEE